LGLNSGACEPKARTSVMPIVVRDMVVSWVLLLEGA
jgi:hypothetical protein